MNTLRVIGLCCALLVLHACQQDEEKTPPATASATPATEKTVIVEETDAISLEFGNGTVSGSFQLGAEGSGIGDLSIVNVESGHLCSVVGKTTAQGSGFTVSEEGCSATIVLTGKNVSISSKGCEEYCGMGMEIDGTYRLEVEEEIH
jgi:hypothetical protein